MFTSLQQSRREGVQRQGREGGSPRVLGVWSGGSGGGLGGVGWMRAGSLPPLFVLGPPLSLPAFAARGELS